MRERPTTFIFDLDGVLCRYDLPARLDCLARATGLDADDIRARLWGSGFEDAADAGQFADGKSYLAEFDRRLDYPLTREQWIAARRASMTPYPEMLDLVARLDATGDVAVLTNNVPLFADTLDELFPQVPQLFGDRIFFSCHMHHAKPDPQAYLHVCRRLGCAPAETVFVDDKARNADGATRAGLTGIHFTGTKTLAAQLVRLGVPV